MKNQGINLFDDAMTHKLVEQKKEVNPKAIFIGRNHPNVHYGQTGYLLYNNNNKPVFLPDTDEEVKREFEILINEAVRCEELITNPAPYYTL